VVLTPLFGRLFFRESVSAGNLAGALVAIGGVWVLTNPAEGGFGRGEVLTAVSAVAFAFQIQLTNAVTRRHSPEGVTFVMFVFATLASGAILAGLGTSPSALVRSLAAPHVAWTVLYTAVACSALAVALMNRFQRDLPPTRAAVLYTLEPVFAALFAAILMDEPMTARKLAGGAIIAGGNLACELLRPRE
jgi:drug/metabolite transporter (DMT)-like permease